MDKEVLVAISFRELYGRDPDDDSDGDAPFATFYKDGTYRVDHWQKDWYAQWKIEGSEMLIKHEGPRKKWVNAGEGSSTQRMVELVFGALLVEELLTGKVEV